MSKLRKYCGIGCGKLRCEEAGPRSLCEYRARLVATAREELKDRRERDDHDYHRRYRSIHAAWIRMLAKLYRSLAAMPLDHPLLIECRAFESCVDRALDALIDPHDDPNGPFGRADEIVREARTAPFQVYGHVFESADGEAATFLVGYLASLKSAIAIWVLDGHG
jgi:hypothetical protein